jgi:sporulation protein YlmC with PRC-barrel domain
MKFSEIMENELYAEGEKIGVIKDIYIDPQEWEVTHLELQLTKEAAKEILGAKTSIRNMLAISALKKGAACCTNRGIEIKLSKAQLHIYLRPPE